jgi:rfaE bifunctional protein kinase chain/domain
MVALPELLSQLKTKKIMVIGDLILDRYTVGKTERISPEAPVPVLHVDHEEQRLGGAANVAINLRSLGAEVSLLGRVGNDLAGHSLQTILDQFGISSEAVYAQEGMTTPLKNRLIAQDQQLIRIDFENVTELCSSLETKILEQLPRLLNGIDAVAISDYGKGFLSAKFLQKIIPMIKEKGIPIVSDPKGTDFTRYTGSTVLKPNLSEAIAVAKLPANTPLVDVAQKIQEETDVETLMITRSEKGISLFSKTLPERQFPVRVKEVRDVTGAGDTVLAVISLALANKMSIDHASELSNLAAGLAVEHVGCACITIPMMTESLLGLSLKSKIVNMNEGEVLETLQQMPGMVKVTVDFSNELTVEKLKELASLSRRENKKLLLSIKDYEGQESSLHLLASLEEVAYILVKEEETQLIH